MGKVVRKTSSRPYEGSGAKPFLKRSSCKNLSYESSWTPIRSGSSQTSCCSEPMYVRVMDLPLATIMYPPKSIERQNGFSPHRKKTKDTTCHRYRAGGYRDRAKAL